MFKCNAPNKSELINTSKATDHFVFFCFSSKRLKMTGTGTNTSNSSPSKAGMKKTKVQKNNMQ